jgi:hypothetical protein
MVNAKYNNAGDAPFGIFHFHFDNQGFSVPVIIAQSHSLARSAKLGGVQIVVRA